MNEVNIYLTDLINEGKLSHKDAEIFLDYAYDLVLNGESEDVVEDLVLAEINKELKERV